MGVVYEKLEKYEAAITAYRQALSLPEDKTITPTTAHTLAHNNLGFLLQQQGDLEAAIREYEQAVQIDPDFEPARNNLKKARRALDLRNNP